MHTRQSPAKAGDCGYARPFSSIKRKKNDTVRDKEKIGGKNGSYKFSNHNNSFCNYLCNCHGNY